MQAARGTPVDDDHGSDRSGGSLLAAPRTWGVFAAAWLVLLAADQVTKILAVRHLTDRPDVELVGEVLQLHLTYNPGAAFSIGTDYTWAFTVLAIVATFVVLWLSRRLASRWWAVALAFLLAGITGNLVDRLVRDPEPFRGHVVDFLMLPNWPVFNVADVCINLGVAMVLIQVLRGIDLGGRRLSDADDESDEDAVGETQDDDQSSREDAS